MVDQSFKLCFFFWRRFKLRAVEVPDDIREVFSHYSENGAMNVDQLHEFLREVQGEVNATRENAQDILNKLKHHVHMLQHPKEFYLESFFRYLLGDDNVALREPGKVYHDMNAPLAHYFVFTGHNSYLTGNQFCSKCSVTPIIKALKNGVRVIELDLWPGGNDVVVRHGGTVTRSVKLVKCLRAIKENAFHASEYPVIITFEDHLNSILRIKVAKMVTETFGHMLFCPRSDLVEFPSPEFLKWKILISTKQPGAEGLLLDPLEIWISGEENALEDDETEDKAPPEYKQIIAIHAGKLTGIVTEDLCMCNDTSKVWRLSLSEDVLLQNVEENNGKHFLRFSQRNLLRIYPKGSRLFSSNFDPLTAWVHGAQMVAFNMQGNDEYLRLMQGMFRANGGCGYIKKPEILLRCEANCGAFDPQTETMPIKTTLKVKVYMGEGWHLDFHHTHFDTWSPPDLYAKIGIAGVSADNRHMVKTKTENDQWAPVWNAEFEFPLRVPELAFLVIQVHDEDPPLQGRDFAGQTCLPISELRTGIRSVPLYDKKGNKYRFVKLLLQFRFV
ncbi:phospholipase [Lithospermum erythrorhizon]|uniref:Phosphoinositide phospholipase C n=1 Tax=Lithospermum erythrorhizon TaxID=34254 RepID=A0AAV3QH35_LITER